MARSFDCRVFGYAALVLAEAFLALREVFQNVLVVRGSSAFSSSSE
jgi:hypothetical protein